MLIVDTNNVPKTLSKERNLTLLSKITMLVIRLGTYTNIINSCLNWLINKTIYVDASSMTLCIFGVQSKQKQVSRAKVNTYLDNTSAYTCCNIL